MLKGLTGAEQHEPRSAEGAYHQPEYFQVPSFVYPFCSTAKRAIQFAICSRMNQFSASIVVKPLSVFISEPRLKSVVRLNIR